MAKRKQTVTQVVDGKETVIEREMDVAAPEGHVVLKGGNASVEGVEYHAESDGLVFVREEHADELVRDHGFERV